MAFTFNSDIAYVTAGSTSSSQAVYTGLTWVAGWEWAVIHSIATNNSGTTDNNLISATVSDGTNSLTFTRPSGGQVNNDYSLPTATNRCHNVSYARCSDATPGALSTSAGACTLTLVYANALAAGCAMGITGLDAGTSASDSLRAIASVDSGDTNVASVTHANMDIETDGIALTMSWSSNAGTIDTSSGWTESEDSAMITSRRGQTQYLQALSNQTVAPVIDLASTNTGRITSFLLWFKEVNNADVNTASTAPFEPGETVTFAGTALDVTGAGARIRKSGGTSSYDALTSYSPSSATAATAVIANRPARTPYTSEDGTTHTIEFIATTSGTVTGTATTAITTANFVPPSGYSRVTITAPDLTANSLLYYLGWTSVAGDQIEWDNSVTVDGTAVTVTVNSDGTVSLDSGANPMPDSVPFYWRAYSTASEQWTGSASDQSDWATATFGASGVVSDESGLSMSALRRRRRR